MVGFMPWLLYPKGRAPVPILLGAGWVPEPVCTLWRREKSFDCARNGSLILGFPALTLVSCG